MRGTPVLAATSAQSMIAVICGTPMPAMTRVVHIVAGPNADFDGICAGRD